jgi:hypothetical protein
MIIVIVAAVVATNIITGVICYGLGSRNELRRNHDL